MARTSALSALISLLCAASLAACSWTFDDTAPDLPLHGEAPELSRFPKLNAGPARDVYILRDDGGQPWAVIIEAATTDLTVPPLTQRDTVRLVSLAPAEAPVEEAHKALIVAALYRSVALLDPPVPPMPGQLPDLSAPTVLRIVRPGGRLAGPFMLPSGSPVLVPSSRDGAFLYIAQRPDAKLMYLVRTDGSYRRELPLPMGVDPTKALEKMRLQFLDDSTLLVQDPKDQVTLFGSTSEAMVALGKHPRTFLLDREQRALLTCSEAGVRRVPLDGAEASTLETAPCDPDILRLDGRARGDTLLYLSDGALREVPQAGGAPPKVVLPEVGQLHAIGPRGELLYSLDPPLRFGSGIGDGWLDGTRVMERGRRPAWSSSGGRLRWLEAAARSDNTGELTSLDLTSRVALTLARNVRSFAETPDGRVLAIANAAQRGPHNRLVVVDEQRQAARWVAPSARDFVRIPGTDDVLLKAISGQFIDVYRVPVPPPEK
jgi:hypothetical protein